MLVLFLMFTCSVMIRCVVMYVVSVKNRFFHILGAARYKIPNCNRKYKHK